MSDQRLEDFLEHIRRAASESAAFIEGKERSDFFQSPLVQKAVLMNFVIIGEAARNIMDRYPEFAEAHPEVPWHGMRGIRNRVTHVYFDVDLDLVWETVKVHLPRMIARLPDVPKNENKNG
ncbi:MAG: DUF86 domain-containing protein [Lautropia sp.]|nr:DUF86 domain-containing protein [Lautropia sp.]